MNFFQDVYESWVARNAITVHMWNTHPYACTVFLVSVIGFYVWIWKRKNKSGERYGLH